MSGEGDLLVNGLKLLGVAALSAVLTMAAVIGLGRTLLPASSVAGGQDAAQPQLIHVDDRHRAP